MVDYRDIIKPGLAIGIIDADQLDGRSRQHNIALMRISGYCKSQGCEVRLLKSYDDIPQYDVVFVSKIFSFTNAPDNIAQMENVYCGGTGFYEDGGSRLPDEIEYHAPDRTLYE